MSFHYQQTYNYPSSTHPMRSFPTKMRRARQSSPLASIVYVRDEARRVLWKRARGYSHRLRTPPASRVVRRRASRRRRRQRVVDVITAHVGIVHEIVRENARDDHGKHGSCGDDGV
jgi:hypothetical protein